MSTRRSFCYSIVAASSLTLTGCVTSSEDPGENVTDWPIHGRTAGNSNYTPDRGPITEPTLAWEYETAGGDQEISSSGIWANPAVVDGAVYVGNFHGHFYALDSETGDQLWSYHDDGPTLPFPTFDLQHGGHFEATPWVTDTHVLAANWNGNVYSFNRDDGSLDWDISVSEPIRSSPLVIDNIVYIATYDGTLLAVDISDGDTIWTMEFEEGFYASPATDGEVFYIPSFDGNLYEINQSGESTVLYAAEKSLGPSPTILEDRLILSGFENEQTLCISLDSGDLEWVFDAEVTMGTDVAVNGDMAYVGGHDDQLHALDIHSGDVVWQYPVDHIIYGTAPVVAEETVYVGSMGGWVYAVAAESGEEKWSYMTNGSIRSAPTVVGDTIYFGSFDHSMYALR